MSNQSLVEQLVFEDCRYPYILQVSDGYRYMRLCFFIFEVALALVGLGLMYMNRTDKRIVVRTNYSFILHFITFITNSIGYSLSEYSLDKPSVLNQCEFYIPLSTFAAFSYVWILVIRVVMYYNGYQVFNAVTSTEEERKSRMSTDKKKLNKLFYRASPAFAKKIFIFALVSSSIVGFIELLVDCPQSFSPDVTCPVVDDNYSNEIVFATSFLLFIMLFLVTLYKTKNYPDPFGILFEMKLIVPFYVTALLSGVISTVLIQPTELRNLYATPFFLSVGYFMPISYLILVIYPCYLSMKRSSANVNFTMKEILENTEARKLFKKQLEIEQGVESLNCYDAIVKFEEDYGEKDTQTRSNVAKNIFRKYISDETAEYPVNIGYKVRGDAKRRYEENEVKQDMFQKIKTEMEDILEFDAFPRFRRGPYYALFIGLSTENSIESLQNV